MARRVVIGPASDPANDDAGFSDAFVDEGFAAGTLKVTQLPPPVLTRLYLRVAEQLPLRTRPEAIALVEGLDLSRTITPPAAAVRFALHDALARVRKAVLVDDRLPHPLRRIAGEALLKQDPAKAASQLLAIDVATPDVLPPSLVWQALTRLVERGESRHDRSARRALAARVVASLVAEKTADTRLAMLRALRWPDTLSLLSDDDVVDVVAALFDAYVIGANATWSALLVRTPRGLIALAARAGLADAEGLRLLLGSLDVDAGAEVVDELWRARRRLILHVAPPAVMAHPRIVRLALSALASEPEAATQLLSSCGPGAHDELVAVAARYVDHDEKTRAVLRSLARNDSDVIDAIGDSFGDAVARVVEDRIAAVEGSDEDAADVELVAGLRALGRRGDERSIAMLAAFERRCARVYVDNVAATLQQLRSRSP